METRRRDCYRAVARREGLPLRLPRFDAGAPLGGSRACDTGPAVPHVPRLERDLYRQSFRHRSSCLFGCRGTGSPANGRHAHGASAISW